MVVYASSRATLAERIPGFDCSCRQRPGIDRGYTRGDRLEFQPLFQGIGSCLASGPGLEQDNLAGVLVAG